MSINNGHETLSACMLALTLTPFQVDLESAQPSKMPTFWGERKRSIVNGDDGWTCSFSHDAAPDSPLPSTPPFCAEDFQLHLPARESIHIEDADDEAEIMRGVEGLAPLPSGGGQISRAVKAKVRIAFFSMLHCAHASFKLTYFLPNCSSDERRAFALLLK